VTGVQTCALPILERLLATPITSPRLPANNPLVVAISTSIYRLAVIKDPFDNTLLAQQ